MADLRKYMPGDFYGDTPANKMVQLMAKIGHNDELQLDVGFITNLNPMEIKLQDGLLLDEEDFSLPERLTKHYEWHNGTRVAVDPKLKIGDALIGIMDEVWPRYMVVDRISKSEAEEWIEPEGSIE